MGRAVAQSGAVGEDHVIEERGAVGFLDGVDGHDARVIEDGERLSLSAEALQALFVFCQLDG